MADGALPIDFPQHLIEHELGHGETMLWAGRPRQGIFLRGHDALYIPFALLLGGFVLVTVIQMIERGKLEIVPSFMAAVWLYALVGRFLVDTWKRSKTYYVATDQQVFVVFSRSVRSLKLRDLYTSRLTLGRRGRGTISFGALGVLTTYLGTQAPNVLIFDSIENAGNVYEMIRPHVPK